MLCREIRKHQRNNLSSLLLAFVSPFLVLKRPWLGDEALGLFPWGYFETTDRLLVLGRSVGELHVLSCLNAFDGIWINIMRFFGTIR